MKMNRLKDFVAGALVTTLVLGTAPMAFAKVANMNIPVQYNNIKIVVDGKQLSTSKEPFIYDGTTYLPIRAVAEAVGKDVTWDAATKTAYLGEVPMNPTTTSIGKSFSYEGMNVEYLGYELTENFAGEECLTVYYQFTNNSGKDKLFGYSFDDTAFQNGVALDNSLFHVNEDSKNSSRTIKSGTSIKVASSFVLKGDRSEITLQVEPWMSMKDEILMEAKIKL